MEQSENVNKTQMKSASRMPNTCTLGKATGASPSDNDSSSPGVSSSIPVVSSEARSKLAKDDLAVEVSSRRPGAAPRSHSNPKERLSLPNTGQISFSRPRKLLIMVKRIVSE
ncbi:IQ-domain 5 [Raphanus sativus]|nr:IQ-domain 5 [Raphanus sativus]